MCTLKPCDILLFRFQVKKTNELNFAQKVKFHGFAEKFNVPVCNACTHSRDSLVRQYQVHERAEDMDPLRNATTDYLTKFGGFLYHPDNPGGEASKLHPLIFFWWSSMICKPTNYAANNSFYDAANVLVNTGLCLLNWAGRTILRSTVSTAEKIEKECYAACCEAAGMIEKARDLLAQHYEEQLHTPIEARVGFVEGLLAMALAGAQELGTLRAMHKEEDKERMLMKDQLSPELITKLLHQCAQLYQEAHNHFKKVDKGDDGLTVIMKFCLVKSHAYMAYANIGMAFTTNKKGDNASAMASVRKAKAVAQNAVKLAKEMKKADKDLIRWALSIQNEADAKIAKFDRENTMVFHQKIADDPPELVPPQVLARAKPYDLPRPSEELWSNNVFDQFVVKGKAIDDHAKKELDDWEKLQEEEKKKDTKKK
eukprot:TRINITY_DN58380_c0_g1_i1.p1 TRINITY_DN58380_c0_g1~~TRINITY_DN58380_c0_g1_i1.p1  ORF type:complete len:426 (+),score=81.42 TRINITY_DN58380_c0_g1_i1:96-1373(+)